MSISVSERGSRRRGLIYLVLVLVAVGLLAVSGSGPVADVRRAVSYAVAPVRDSLTDGTRSITGVFDALSEVDTLKRENLEMVERIDELEDQVATLDAVRDENRRLARVLKTVNALDRETVVATVISEPASSFERMLIIDRGTDDGIDVDHPVLSSGGALAGIVVEVGASEATIQLISDTRSVIIGRDKRTRATGEVEGRLGAPLAMRQIPVTEEIALGDTIVTAGLGSRRRFRSRFPANLPIGQVIDIREEAGLTVQTALLEPAAPLERLEHVIVITDHEGPERPDPQASETAS